jgi:hypothetical protein
MRPVRFFAVASVLIGCSVVGRASADEADVAEQLFRDGHALLRDQRYSEACAKLAESQQHDPASGTLLALAYCQELGGLLASAQASYLAAAELARAETQDERQHAASQRALELTARLSTLTIRVPRALWFLPGLRITNNGVEQARASWGRPVASDGGELAIRVTAPGHNPWSTHVNLRPEQDQRVVDVPVLTEEGAAMAPPPGPRTEGRSPSSAHSAATRHYWTTARTVGWAAIGAGALSGAAALYYTASAASAQSDVESLLRAQRAAPADARAPWDAAGHAREAEGRHAATLAQGFGVASGVLLLGGAALVIFGGDKADHETPSVSLGFAPGEAQVGYARVF